MAKKKPVGNTVLLKNQLIDSKIEVKKEASQTTQPFQLNSWLVVSILLILTFGIYAIGFKNQFLSWDDSLYVTENEFILNPTKNWGTILKMVCAANYHPLTMLSLAFNVLLFGKGATSFIVVNTLIHTANTYLVYIFAKKLTNNNQFVSFFIALFFGIHPMHVESVVWVSERKDVLYVFFFLGACITYINYLTTNQKKWLGITFLLFVFSCLAKGMAVVLPFVLLLLDYWYDKKVLNAQTILEKIPFFGFSLFWGLITLNVQGGGDFYGLLINNTQASAYNANWTIVDKIIFAGYSTTVYFFKLFLPINLHNFYAYPPLAEKNGAIYMLGFCAMLVLLATTIWAYITKKKVVFFGLGFFFITLLLVLQVISVGSAILAERYTYLPYVGLSFMVLYVFEQKLSKNISLLYGIGGIMAIFFIFKTVQYIPTWKNTISIWENTYAFEEDKKDQFSIGELAAAYGRTGDVDKTIMFCEKVENPSYKVLGYLANAYTEKGNYSKAIENYNKAITSLPKNKQVLERSLYYNRGVAYKREGLFDLAIQDFNTGLTLGEKQIKILPIRANSYLDVKNYSNAMQDYNEIINLGFANDTTYADRGIAQYNLGDKAKAIEDLKKAISINPTNINAKNNLEKLLQIK